MKQHVKNFFFSFTRADKVAFFQLVLFFFSFNYNIMTSNTSLLGKNVFFNKASK